MAVLYAHSVGICGCDFPNRKWFPGDESYIEIIHSIDINSAYQSLVKYRSRSLNVCLL